MTKRNELIDELCTLANNTEEFALDTNRLVLQRPRSFRSLFVRTAAAFTWFRISLPLVSMRAAAATRTTCRIANPPLRVLQSLPGSAPQ